MRCRLYPLDTQACAGFAVHSLQQLTFSMPLSMPAKRTPETNKSLHGKLNMKELLRSGIGLSALWTGDAVLQICMLLTKGGLHACVCDLLGLGLIVAAQWAYPACLCKRVVWVHKHPATSHIQLDNAGV
jgi:hypothetical protein